MYLPDLCHSASVSHSSGHETPMHSPLISVKSQKLSPLSHSLLCGNIPVPTDNGHTSSAHFLPYVLSGNLHLSHRSEMHPVFPEAADNVKFLSQKSISNFSEILPLLKFHSVFGQYFPQRISDVLCLLHAQQVHHTHFLCIQTVLLFLTFLLKFPASLSIFHVTRIQGFCLLPEPYALYILSQVLPRKYQQNHTVPSTPRLYGVPSGCIHTAFLQVRPALPDNDPLYL